MSILSYVSAMGRPIGHFGGDWEKTRWDRKEAATCRMSDDMKICSCLEDMRCGLARGGTFLLGGVWEYQLSIGIVPDAVLSVELSEFMVFEGGAFHAEGGDELDGAILIVLAMLNYPPNL